MLINWSFSINPSNNSMISLWFSAFMKLSLLLSVCLGEKPFSCPECGKCLRRKFDLKKHMLSHSSVRPYACVYCPKSYTRKTHLNRHLLTHRTTDSEVVAQMADETWRSVWWENCVFSLHVLWALHLILLIDQSGFTLISFLQRYNQRHLIWFDLWWRSDRSRLNLNSCWKWSWNVSVIIDRNIEQSID